MNMNLVDRAILAPSRCSFCGRNDGAMIDTGITRPQYGRQYVCVTSCLADQIHVAGGMTGPEADALAKTIATQRDLIATMEVEVNRLQTFERVVADARDAVAV